MAAKSLGEKEAARYNTGKTRLGLNSALAYYVSGIDTTYGAIKYDDNNWAKGMPFSDMMDSFERHYFAWKMGEDIDEESGIPHIFMALWNMMALAEYTFTHPDKDDRRKLPKVSEILNEIKDIQKKANERALEYKRGTEKKPEEEIAANRENAVQSGFVRDHVERPVILTNQKREEENPFPQHQ